MLCFMMTDTPPTFSPQSAVLAQPAPGQDALGRVISALWRYPVKGLSAQPLTSVAVETGEGFPVDRRFALAYSSADIEQLPPLQVPRHQIITLASHPSLAALTTRWIDFAQTLTIERKRRQVGRGNLGSPLGKVMLAEFFAAYLKAEVRGTPHVLEAPVGEMFTDQPRPTVKIISASSLRDLERITGAPVDPCRFRANIMLEGAPAWDEFGWIGGSLTIGSAVVRIVGRISQTSSASVEPGTGKTDLNVPRLLQKGFGHGDFGVYGEVVAGGSLAVGQGWALNF